MATIATHPPISTAPEAIDPVNAATSAGSLLVASDGTGSSDPAFAAASLLAERLHVAVEVLTVFEPVPSLIPSPALLAMAPAYDAAAMDQLRDRVLLQTRRLAGAGGGWRVELQAGDPAGVVRRTARERDAGLVITGVGRHGIVDRVFGEETAAHIANRTDTPLLAVTPGFSQLPRNVLFAIDLDSPAIPDSPAIRALLSEATAVYFVNVKPRVNTSGHFEVPAWHRTYDDAMEESRARVIGSLDLPSRVTQQAITLTGTPARAILSFAEYAKVDLIVVGQRRRSLLQRKFGQGMPVQMLRAASCPVLVLPRNASGTATQVRADMSPSVQSTRTETITDRRAWPARLALISRKNGGRQAMLEVDDSEFGAQVQASGYPFVGLHYDHNDDRVGIMLGARLTGAGHLTHYVERPTSIDVLEGHDGRVLALRVATDRGQALISFLF